MSGDPARFLNAFAQALAAMALYRDGHPARERALDVAYQQIQDLQAETARPLFTSLGDEVDTLHWMQREVQTTGAIPLAEAEAVVRSLAVAMHGGRQVMLPLLQLKEFDQYTTTHSMNVAVLSMALAEFLGLSATDVRTFGIAGLLHDIGKVKIPLEVLTKPGKLTDEERALMNQHPVAGARMLLEAEEDLDLAVIVAYEHHIMINGGGYPTLHYPRDCHQASKLVHVCDVYDALRTRRPYREAWSFAKTLGYLEERSELEFDTDRCATFSRQMRQWEPQVAVVSDAGAPVAAAASPAAAKPEPGGV